MPNFTSIEALNAYLENKVLPEVLKSLAKEIRQMVQDYIYENLYQSYYPKEYQRTGDFLDSLDVRVLDKHTVEIFFNTDRIRSEYVEDSWNQHMSIDGSEVWNGASVPEWLPYFIEWGTHNSLWDRDGLHSMEKIKEQVEQTKFHLTRIVEMLRAKGIIAKII